MNWALETAKGSKLTPSQRLVLMVLAHHHHDKTNACFPAIATIAEIVGLTPRRVQIALRALDSMGLISVSERSEHGRQRSNQYDLFGKLRADASVTPSSRSRTDASVTPKALMRGDGGDAPQKHRGVTLASPDRLYTSDGGNALASGVINFPRNVAVG